jgi:hypothetical protein
MPGGAKHAAWRDDASDHVLFSAVPRPSWRQSLMIWQFVQSGWTGPAQLAVGHLHDVRVGQVHLFTRQGISTPPPVKISSLLLKETTAPGHVWRLDVTKFREVVSETMRHLRERPMRHSMPALRHNGPAWLTSTTSSWPGQNSTLGKTRSQWKRWKRGKPCAREGRGAANSRCGSAPCSLWQNGKLGEASSCRIIATTRCALHSVHGRCSE